jgi:adenylosuccinate synthase
VFFFFFCSFRLDAAGRTPSSLSHHPHPISIHHQGGANAGHTIYDDAGTKYKLHLIPSGILHPRARCVVGNGVVVHLPGLFEELATLASQGVTVPDGRLMISDRAHLLFDLHKEVDGAREAELAGGQIGTTKRGIGPAYASKATRNGARVGDLRDVPGVLAPRLRALAADAAARFPGIDYDVEADIKRYEEYAEKVKPLIGDTVSEINDAVDAGARVLVEGANATMLDLDFGTYPFVTSSNPSIGGVIAGLGLAPSKLGAVIGVAKAYTTRVGAGPYPTEIEGALADELRAVGAEYGTTTGRPRRIGWLDVPALRYAARINGLTHLNLTKLDVLSGLDTIRVGVGYELDGAPLKSFPSSIGDLERVSVVYEDLPGWKSDISGARAWDDLPAAAKAYIARVEELVGVKCAWIGVGPGRDAIVTQPGTVE